MLKKWTVKEEQYLMDQYEKIGVKKVGEILGRTPGSVYSHLSYIKVPVKKTKLKSKLKTEKLITTGRTTLVICPSCKGWKINDVKNAFLGAKYFCCDCLKEYDRYGRYVEPIK